MVVKFTARHLGLGLLALAVFFTVAVAFGIALIVWTPLLERMASASLGRSVRIDRVDVDPGIETDVSIEGLQVAGAMQGNDSNLLSVESVRVVVEPLSIFLGSLEVPKISITGIRSRLSRDADGRGNWVVASQAGVIAQTAAPEERAEFPRLGKLVINDAEFDFHDAASGLDLAGRLDKLEAVSNGADGISLSLSGAIDGRPLALEFVGGAFQTLRGSERPYPVNLELTLGGASVKARGTFGDPIALDGIELAIEASGPTVSALFPLVPVALPATAPFELSGALERSGRIWTLSDLEGRLGDSDIDGEAVYDAGSARPRISGSLHSVRLDLDDLAPVIGEQPDPSETASASQREAATKDQDLFPHVELPSSNLRIADADLSYAAESISTSLLPLESADVQLSLNDGRLLVELRSVAIADGEVTGELALNAREETPSADANLQIQELNLKAFFQGTELETVMSGRFGGRAYLLGTGRSLADILASARGDGRMTIRDASLSGLLVEAIGLDVIEALGLVLGDGTVVAVRCGALEFTARDGILLIEEAIADTTDSVLVASGQVDLGAESIAVQIEARAKDFSILDVAAPVSVSGQLRDPNIGIGAVEGFPIDLGEQEDLDCSRVLSGEPKPAGP